MNYSVNHKLLQLEVFADLKGVHRTATLLVLSAVDHFTINVGYLDFYQKQFAEDVGINRKTIRLAESTLIAAELIKPIRLYQRKGNLPTRYVSTRLGLKQQKVGTKTAKGWAPGTQVNNTNLISKQNDGVVNTPHPSLNEQIEVLNNLYTSTQISRQEWEDRIKLLKQKATKH